MNCARFEERVLQLLDRREDIAAAVDLIPHANRCARCARTREIGMVMGEMATERFEDLATCASDLPAPSEDPTRSAEVAFPVPEGFADRVLSAWRTESVSAAVGLVAAKGWKASSGADQASRGRISAAGEESAATSVSRAERMGAWVRPLAWFSTLAAAMLLLLSFEGFRERAVPERLQPLVVRTVPRAGESPFVMVEVDRWTPVLNSLGDESMAVVRPLTRSLHLAYDLLKQHLLGGNGLEKIDARRFETDVYWS